MIDRGCASSGGASYYRAFNEYFRPEWAITDLTTGFPICLQSKKVGQEHNPLAGLLSSCCGCCGSLSQRCDHECLVGWPLLDDAGSQCNPRFAAIVADSSDNNFDVDGDSQPDSIATMVAQWQAFRPYLFRKLREVVGHTISCSPTLVYLTAQIALVWSRWRLNRATRLRIRVHGSRSSAATTMNAVGLPRGRTAHRKSVSRHSRARLRSAHHQQCRSIGSQSCTSYHWCSSVLMSALSQKACRKASS